MSRPTALQVVRTALQQYHITEYPAGSNNVKYNTAYYGHAVHGDDYAWCATFVWWVGWIAAGKDQKLNPFVKNANAADIQTLTVKQKWGKYILVHTANNTKKKAALPKVKMGDEISFNFNGGTSRVHTAIIVGRWGNYYWCIEGNTSFDDKGSQSNGGAVAYRERYYTTGVCIVRPDYADGDFYKPKTAYLGQLPKLPTKRGYFIYGDKGNEVKKLQAALAWANGYQLATDGELKSYTFAEIVIFQIANGLEPDAQFGEKCLRKLKAIIKEKTKNMTQDTTNTTKAAEIEDKEPTSAPEQKTLGEKIAEKAVEDSYAYGTKKKKYTYPTGKPKKQYKEDLEKVYPNHKNWSERPEHGRSCDVAVGVFVRASGADKSWPRGLDEIEGHVKKHPKKWKKIKNPKESELKEGDIIYQIFNSGKGHLSVYVGKNKSGNGRIANAHYYANQYPIIQSFKSKVRKKSQCKKFYAYRRKD